MWWVFSPTTRNTHHQLHSKPLLPGAAFFYARMNPRMKDEGRRMNESNPALLMIHPSSFILLPCVDPAAVYATFPLLATEPVRLPGDLAPLQGAVDRRQSQPGQGLQLRLRLLL